MIKSIGSSGKWTQVDGKKPYWYWVSLARSEARLVDFRYQYLDFYNAILAGLPKSTMAPFQRAQNAAVRMTKRLGSRDHISQSWRNLHWLPIRYHVIYKLCILMHMVHNGFSPGYISELVSAMSALPGRRRLRSTCGNRYEIPVIHHKIGEWAFFYAGTAAWNSLPTTLINMTDTQTFKCSLKTYLFKLAYNVWLYILQRLWSQGGDILHIVIWV